MTMAAAKKTKRPFAIWLSQFLLLGLFGMFVYTAVSVWMEPENEPIAFSDFVENPSWVFRLAVGWLIIFSPFITFLGLCFRVRVARWLSILLLGGFFALVSYFTLTAGEDESPFYFVLDDPMLLLEDATSLLLLLVAPLLACILLLFSPKVKSFFTSCLDDDGAVTSPPPPPEFD